MTNKTKLIIKMTNNRSEFNRAYKAHLEQTGKIRCTYCKYHCGENKTTNYYGGLNDKLKYPNWKLVSKNNKQWMKKSIKNNVNKLRYDNQLYIEIIW